MESNSQTDKTDRRVPKISSMKSIKFNRAPDRGLDRSQSPQHQASSPQYRDLLNYSNQSVAETPRIGPGRERYSVSTLVSVKKLPFLD